MKIKPSEIFKSSSAFIYSLFASLNEHNALEISGYLAFSTFISIFPFVIFLAKLAGFFTTILSTKFDEENLLKLLINALDNTINLPVNSLKEEIKNTLIGPPKALVKYAIIGIIWSASSAIEGIRTALNRAYHAEDVQSYFTGRMFSILQFFIISFFIILLIVLFNILPITKYTYDQHKLINFISLEEIFNWATIFIYILWLHFTLPARHLPSKKLLPGVIITTILWIISSKVLRVYFIKFSQFSIIYGGLANIVSILLFFHVIFLCFILGAELNMQLYLRSKNKILHQVI